MMPRLTLISILILAATLLPPGELLAEPTPAEQMQQLLSIWPPTNWQLTPPGGKSPYQAYVTAGEFSGTVYQQNKSKKTWSAHISITDQQNPRQAKRMLNKFSYCEETNFNNFPARTCSTLGENLGRRSLAYVVNRYLIEISVIGPLPLRLPELDLNAPLINNK